MSGLVRLPVMVRLLWSMIHIARGPGLIAILQRKWLKMARRGLGRGLEALIPEIGKPVKGEKNTIIELPLDRIKSNKNQPRSQFNDQSLDELAESIREFGVLQPIIVRSIDKENNYEIVAGERRYRAIKKIGINTIPSLILSDVDDISSLEMALIENIHRDDLSPLEQAFSYKYLIEEFSITHNELSIKIGKNRATITNILRLLSLPLEVQKLLAEEKISEGHARAILSIKEKEGQIKVAKKAAARGLSVRDVERLVNLEKEQQDSRTAKITLQFSKIPKITEQLSNRLNSPVKIIIGKKKGKIEIEFGTIRDLERVVRKIVG